MILVLGNDPRRVELLDIGDTVYYRQQKSFSEAQYTRSKDLQKAISKGSLTVLSRTPEKDGNFSVPSAQVVMPPTAQDSRIAVLLEKIASLEYTIQQGTVKDSTSQVNPDIDKRINDLEQRLSQAGSSALGAEVLTALKRLEEKVGVSDRNSDVFDRLESILSRAPGTAEAPKEEPRRVEDVYVPTVMVEDANAHIKLDTRIVEKSDSMDDALKALKQLKKNQ